MRIGVYGLGRFGSFWAKLLGERADVFAYNRSERDAPPGVTKVDLPALAACDAIFLCCAISAMPEVCRELAPLVRPGTLVADTCSVKVWPVKVMTEAFSPEIDLLATHPMFGPDSARNGAEGLPLVLSSVRDNPRTLKTWSEFFSGLGLKVLVMSPDEHDREAAETQGITHVMGRLFASLGLKPSEMGTQGYRKLLEVMDQTCNDPYRLFLDLQRYNPYSEEMRKRLAKGLAELELVLRSSD